MSENKIRSLLRKARLAQKKIDDAKDAHKEMDALITELRRLKFKRNQYAIIRDNFKLKNTQYKVTFFKRYTLEFFND